MARLESQAKLLYYPTPNGVVDTLSTWFSAPKAGTRLVDPCCGTGEALFRFAAPFTTHPETWGIELSYARAAQAEKALDLVIPASFYEMRHPSAWPMKSVSCILDNPPYDWSDHFEMHHGLKHRMRHEVLFVETCTHKLVNGGHHVILVPRAFLGGEKLLGQGQGERIARHVLGWYTEAHVYRFPEGEYEAFKQVVILALGKRDKYQPPTKEAIQAFTSWADEDTDLPVLPPGNGQYPLPPAPKATLTYAPVDPAAQLRAVRQCTPLGSEVYRRATHVRPLGAPFTPALPLKVGDLTNLLLGQEAGAVVINGGQTLVKGSSHKVIRAEADDTTDLEGMYQSTHVTEREAHLPMLALAHADGKLEKLETPDQITKFMSKHAEALGAAVLGKNAPLYNFDPTPREWEIASRSARGLPILPGLTEPGLLPIQKHFGIGAVRVMKKHRQAIVEAEPGFGKTLVATLSLEVMDKWPALVLCPGHMVRKWKRTLEASSDPEKPILARVITRPVLKQPPTWVALRNAIQAAGGQVLDTARLQVEAVSPGDPCGRRQVQIACDADHTKEVAQVFKTLTFRDKWRTPEAGWKKVEIPPSIQFTAEGLNVEYVDRDEYTLYDFLSDYKAGRLGEKAVAVISFERAKYDAGLEVTGASGEETDAEKPGQIRPAVNWRWTRLAETDAEDLQGRPGQLVKRPTCPHCGKFVSYIKKRGGKDAHLSRQCDACGTKLYQMSRWRRIGLARLLQRKFRHVFQVYVSDEVHKAKEGSTDVGVADQRLLSAIPYGMALTGTLFGGNAGSLFYLLYRRSAEIRRQYAFDDWTRWVDHYGRWEREWTQDHQYVTGMGASTGLKRWGYRQKELPGVAPGVIRYLLPMTLMAGLSDLGYQLPPLHETILEVPMHAEQREQYDLLADDWLHDEVLPLIEKYADMGVLAAWFTALRFWLNASFRPEVAHYVSKKLDAYGDPEFTWHHDLTPVTTRSQPWLPKEIALADVVRQNMARGRKTLVYLEQTGTRDIRTRLQQALESLVPGGDVTLVEVPKFVFHNQPRVGILDASVNPERREAWVATHVPALDTLLVNPRLVETGLDLVAFSSLVFYEVTPSLYLFLQAMRRVWRLGQDKDVEITYLVYKDSLEAQMLQRVGQKLKAALLLHGEHAVGALIEQDDDDLLREIIRERMRGHAAENMGQALESVLGSLATPLTRPAPLPVAAPVLGPEPTVILTDVSTGTVTQLSLFGEAVPVSQMLASRRRRR